LETSFKPLYAGCENSSRSSFKDYELLGWDAYQSHPATLLAMNDLASSYSDLGRHQEAMLREKTFEARQRTLGSEHPDILLAMNNLGTAFYDMYVCIWKRHLLYA
jgi:tetratricopeptide repeat protein